MKTEYSFSALFTRLFGLLNEPNVLQNLSFCIYISDNLMSIGANRLLDPTVQVWGVRGLLTLIEQHLLRQLLYFI